MKTILAFAFSLLLFSCGDSSTGTVKTDSVPLDSVAKDNTKEAVGNSDSLSKSVPGNDTLPSVTAVVYYNNTYQGGVQPTPEMLKEIKKYRLLSSSKLLLKNKTNSIEVTTDESGIFTAHLVEGKYDVFLTEGINPKIHTIDGANCKDCLAKPVTSIFLESGKVAAIYFTFPDPMGVNMRP